MTVTPHPARFVPTATDEPTAELFSRLLLAGLMIGGGAVRLLLPVLYDRMTPRFVGDAREGFEHPLERHTQKNREPAVGNSGRPERRSASRTDGKTRRWTAGTAEILAGLLLMLPPTRRLGAWMAAVLAAASPAYPRPGPGEAIREVPTAARLPLRALLVLWALRHARTAGTTRRAGATPTTPG